jgi:hypothetical protein
MTGLTKLATGFSIWKMGAIGAAIIAVILTGFLVKTTYDKNNINKQRLELVKRIEDPVTGYVARLATANNNVIVLKGAVEKQNIEFRRQSQAAAAEMARLKSQLVVAHREKAAYEQRVRVLMNQPIKGNTSAERFNDVDQQILKDLQK